MVAVRDRIARTPPLVDYDHFADVLYISPGKPVPDEGEDRPQGIVLRYSVRDNTPCGVTVIGFKRNKWDRRTDELAEIVGAHLTIDRAPIREALKQFAG